MCIIIDLNENLSLFVSHRLWNATSLRVIEQGGCMERSSLSISHTREEDINPLLLATTCMMVSLRLGVETDSK